MKRSSISRGKGFKPRSSRLKATGALRRGAELSRAAAKPKPKPAKRDPAEARARALVAARSEGRCEVCGRAPATNWHHRKNKGQGGAWDAANGLHCCGTGSTGCHGLITINPALAKERGWSVSAYADPADVPVWLANRGWHYLTADGGTTPLERKAA